MNGHDKENHSLLNIGRPVDHDGRRIGAGKGGDPQDDSLPLQATSRANQSSGPSKVVGEAVALQDSSGDQCDVGGKVRWNNAEQGRHWCFTFNNYTSGDLLKIKTALETSAGSEVVSAIVGEEVGESGTPHLQAYIHFKKRLRQSGVHKFFGYDRPCLHLSLHGRDASGRPNHKPPVASFRYCMKDNRFFVVGKNLDEAARVKEKTKSETGESGDAWDEMVTAIQSGEIKTLKEALKLNAELVAMREDFFRSLIVEARLRPVPKDHPYRPWQTMLDEKLKSPFNDREVIFVVDLVGKSGKSWFTEHYVTTKDRISYDVPADKRSDISYQIINKIVDGGDPEVIFMDAPRDRAKYISYAFLEELKDGRVNSPKYKSKTLYIEQRPHVVVMTNEFPLKTAHESGLSEDRYTYLVIDKDGITGRWHEGYLDSGLTAYETIQKTTQTRLPNSLQGKLNRAFNARDFPKTEQDLFDTKRSMIEAIKSWEPSNFN